MNIYYITVVTATSSMRNDLEKVPDISVRKVADLIDFYLYSYNNIQSHI